MKKKLSILLVIAMMFNMSGITTLADAFNDIVPIETEETNKFFEGANSDEPLDFDEETIEDDLESEKENENLNEIENEIENENENEIDNENENEIDNEAENETENESEYETENESENESEIESESEEKYETLETKSHEETMESDAKDIDIESESAETETLENDVLESVAKESESTDESNESIEVAESIKEQIEDIELNISSKSEIDEVVASASDALMLENVNPKLFGARNYKVKRFDIYFHFNKDEKGITLPSRAFGDDRGPYTYTTDLNAMFYNPSTNEHYTKFPFDTREILSILSLENLPGDSVDWDVYYDDVGRRVQIIYGRGEYDDYPMYYVKDIVAKGENGESYTISLAENYDGLIFEIPPEAFTEIENPGDPSENYYELHFYPKEYHATPINSVKIDFIDENDNLITRYEDSRSYYDGYKRSFSDFNFGFRKTDFIVYDSFPDRDIGPYTAKSPGYDNLSSLVVHGTNNRFYNLYKSEDDFRETDYYETSYYDEWDPDSKKKYYSELDKRVNNRNPYYYVFEFVADQSDVAEFPLNEEDLERFNDASYTTKPAHITNPEPTFTFRVRLVTSINFWNNDGTKKINGTTGQLLTVETLVFDKKWPTRFETGAKLINNFNVTGWAFEPNKGKDDDISASIVGTEVQSSQFDSNGELNLYAVGDATETWKIRYEKNIPDDLAGTYTQNKEPVDKEYISIGSVLYDKETGNEVTYISVGTNDYYLYDKENNIAFSCGNDEAYTDEDGTKIAAGTTILNNINSADKISAFFGDDHEKVYKINYYPKKASINFKFYKYDTLEQLGSSASYAASSYAPFADIKVEDNLYDTVLFYSKIIDFFKAKNDAHTSLSEVFKNAYTYGVEDIQYDSGKINWDKLICVNFEIKVYISTTVLFRYYSSDGQTEIDYWKIPDQCYGLVNSKYPKNPTDIDNYLKRKGAVFSGAYVIDWAIATNSRIAFTDWEKDFTGYSKFYAIENYDWDINLKDAPNMRYKETRDDAISFEEFSYTITEKELSFYYNVIPDDGYKHVGWDINGTIINDTTIPTQFTADGMGKLAVKGRIDLTPVIEEIKYTVMVKANGKANFENGFDSTTITNITYMQEIDIPNYTPVNGYYFKNYSSKDTSLNAITFTNKKRVYDLYADDSDTITIELEFGKYKSVINFDSAKVKQEFIDNYKNIFVADFDSTSYNFDNMSSDDAIKKSNIPMVNPIYSITSFEGPVGVTFDDTNADMANAIKSWRTSTIISDFVITAKYSENTKFIYAYIDNSFGTFDYPSSSIEKTTVSGKTFNKVKLYSNGKKLVIPKILYNAGYGFDSYCQDSNYANSLPDFLTWGSSWTGSSDAPAEYQNVYIKTRTLKYIEFVIEDSTKGKWNNNYKYLQVWSEDLSSADLDTYANLVYAAEEKNVIIDIPANLTFRGISENKFSDANSSGASILTLSGLKSLFNTWKSSSPIENKTLYVHFANNTTFTFLYNSDIVRLTDGKAVITAKERHEYTVPTFESAISGIDLNIKWYIDSTDTFFTGDRDVSYTDAEVLQQYNNWVQNPSANRVLSPRYMLPSGDTVNNGCIILEVDENKISSMSPRKFVWTYAEFQSGKSAFTLTEKTGYTFYRWINRSDSSIYADTLAGLNPAENKLIVYTAQFNDAKKKLTLVVDTNKGTLNGLLSSNVFNDPTYFLNNRDYIYVTKKTEERFAGWRDTADDKIYKTLSLYNWDGSKDVTLEAVFKTDPVLTITVDSTKGTYTGKTSYEDLAEFNQDKSTIKNSLTPRPTFKFEGWAGSNSINYKEDLSDFTWDAADDFTLTARFNLIIKHLTFEIDTNNGTFDSSAKLSYDTSELGSIVAPAVTKKLGYGFLNFVKKGTTTVFDPTTWDGVDDLTLVANFEQLAIFKFNIPMVDVDQVVGDTEFDSQSTNILRPTVTPKTGKKQDGWTVNGEYKTDSEVDNIISNWDKTSNLVINILLVELKTLKFEINQDKATIDPSAKLSFDSDDTSITRPSFTVKKGYGLDYWKKGNTSVQDADLAADIAAWRALTESKKEHVIYVAIFRKLKEFKFSVDDNLIDPAHPINKDDLVFDESNPPSASNVPQVTPRYGYNKPSDNGGWTNKKGGTKADILTPEQLRDIIDDWNSKPSDQKPDVELYYVFVEDDTIPKVKFIVDRTKGGFNGGTVYTDTTDFDNAKSSINVVAFNNYKFVGWKDTTTNEQFANASLITWDGSATKVYEAVFDVVSIPNNGGGRNNGGGNSSGGSSSDSYDVKPPEGFNGEINGPFKPIDPNQPPKPNAVNPQDEMSSEEKIANPPSDNFLIVRMDTASSEKDTYTNANLNLNGDGGGDSVFKWETTNRVTWRLMKIDNVVENIDYVKTLDKNVVGSLGTDRIYYYKDGWAFLEYKGTKEWYHFGLNNIMDTGWIFQNGNIYYLQTELNTTYGKMFTGIQTIDGIKYEFGKNGVLKGLAN